MAMGDREARKRERLVNLTICLLAASRPLSRAEIREAVTDYRASKTEAAFQKTFERDKAELRNAGIPIEVGGESAYFPGEDLYRIRRSEAELPDVALTREEATAVALAARAWRGSTMSEATQRALGKLRAVGAEPDQERLAALAAVVAPGLEVPPSLDAIQAAHRNRRRVRFTYHGTERTLEPWLVTSRGGAWYVVGHDVDRAEQRIYRLNRIEDAPTLEGPATQPVPADLDPEAIIRSLAGHRDKLAKIAVRGGHAPLLRRAGRPLDEPAPWPGYTVYEIPYARDELLSEACAAGEDAVVLQPPELRAAVVERLRAIVGEGA